MKKLQSNQLCFKKKNPKAAEFSRAWKIRPLYKARMFDNGLPGPMENQKSSL